MSAIVDISYWQGLPYSESPNDSGIDYDLLASKSPDGVILRASNGSFKDLRFEQNYAELHARGVPLAAYHYFKPIVSVSTQAAVFNAAVSGKALDFPSFSRVLDVEAAATGWTQATYRAAVTAALNQMLGDCVYSRASFWNVALGNWWPVGDPELWVAHYGVADPALPWAKQTFALHQYEADGNMKGAEYGVLSGSIDLNKVGVTIPPPTDPPPVPPPGEKVGKIKQPVNFRAYPVVVDCTKQRVMAAGELVTIIGERDGFCGQDWWKVKDKDGVSGWLAKPFVEVE